jgi:hypothetical protein
MTDWKRTERRVAQAVGGQRVPVTGRARGDAPDVVSDWLAVEVKHRRRLPAWLHEALQQAEASAGDGQLPLVVLHEHGQRHSRDVVVLRLADFVAWFGEVSTR